MSSHTRRNHAEASIAGRHFMLSEVSGRSAARRWTAVIADRPENSSVSVTIENGIGVQRRREPRQQTEISRSFDVVNFPQAKFTSTEIHWDGSQGQMKGDLTIKGETSVGFEATGRIDREDWGLTLSTQLESGGLMVPTRH